MPTVQITESVKLEDVLSTASDRNMTAAQTLDLLWGAIDLVRQRARRVFDYSRTFEAQHAQCRAAFVRGFVHHDWIDGESVVQAESNALEDGFNSRFHKIEADLDALSADIAKAFVCLSEQRAELAQLLGELKAEINRIHGDIYDCCGQSGGGTTITPDWPFRLPPWIYEPPIKWPGLGGPGGVGPIGPGGGGPIGPIGPIDPIDPGWNGGGGWGGPRVYPPWTGSFDPRSPVVPWGDPRVSDPVRNYLDIVSGKNSLTAQDLNILRSSTDPTRGVIGGLTGKVIERTEFNGQKMDVWSTRLGLVMSPSAPGSDSAPLPGWTHPGLETLQRFSGWAATNQKQVREKLGDTFDLGQFTKTFGDTTLEGGVRIADVVSRLPSDLKVKTATDFVTPLAEGVGKDIVRDGLAAEAMIGAAGLNTGGKGGAPAAPVGALKVLSADEAKGLGKLGVKSLGDLAAADPTAVSAKLNDLGLKVDPTRVAGWGGIAAGITSLDKLARGGGIGG